MHTEGGLSGGERKMKRERGWRVCELAGVRVVADGMETGGERCGGAGEFFVCVSVAPQVQKDFSFLPL